MEQTMEEKKISRVLEEEERKCFDFFWNEVSESKESYGLIRDNDVKRDMCSIASVGFGLAGLAVGAERGYVTREDAGERALGTLKTMKEKTERVHGFYYHFLNMEDASRYGKSEVSVIDTALFIMGALVAGEYFGGECQKLSQELYAEVDWEWYRDPRGNRFYMGYNEKQGHFGQWDHYAEQFIMYFLGVAAPEHPVDPSIFYDCPLFCDVYKDSGLIYHSYCGALFVYQFSHAFLNLKGKKDRRGIDWYENSLRATRAARQYCIDNPGQKKTYGPNAWGMTACMTPHGYSGGQGALPCFGNNKNEADGTIPPCGAIGSMPFCPEEVTAAAEHYATIPQLQGKYGFLDAYNLDVEPAWFSDRYIGIDKGVSLLMLENYRSGLIWRLTDQNPFIRKAFELLEIQ
jgi:hypothetical protein